MITIEPKILQDGRIDGAIRELTSEEKATVTSSGFNGTHYVYYQGDEPTPQEPFKIPDFYALEQGLFKSSLFTKYILDYNTKGLLLTTVLQNGKKGEDVNEQTLLTGFAVLQIDFTSEEKNFINTILSYCDFSVQLP